VLATLDGNITPPLDSSISSIQLISVQ